MSPEITNQVLKRNDTFEKFTQAMQGFAEKENPGLDDFTTIAITGVKYFNSIQIICDSILSGTIDESAVTNSHVPGIKKTVEVSLPKFYEVLHTVSKKLGFPYKGELKREDYKSVYFIYEKYCLSK